MYTELIRKRKSVRTYKAEPIPMELMNQVKTYLKKDNGLFDVPVDFTILHEKKDGIGSPVIVGADTYVAGKVRKQKMRNYLLVMLLKNLFFMLLL